MGGSIITILGTTQEQVHQETNRQLHWASSLNLTDVRLKTDVEPCQLATVFSEKGSLLQQGFSLGLSLEEIHGQLKERKQRLVGRIVPGFQRIIWVHS